MKIAVSACLLGERCRYDGASKPNERVMAFARQHDVLPICPEVAGGLSVPHPACEIASDAPLRVCDCAGEDMTAAFVQGAEKTLTAMQDFGCQLAILKAKSPSCGTGRIYDGTFTGTLRDGWGVAAAMIRDAGIPTFDENNFLESCGQNSLIS